MPNVGILIEILGRLRSKSPKLFTYIQYAGYGLMVVSGVVLYLSEKGAIHLRFPEIWEEVFKGIMYTSAGSGVTAHLTTEENK